MIVAHVSLSALVMSNSFATTSPDQSTSCRQVNVCERSDLYVSLFNSRFVVGTICVNQNMFLKYQHALQNHEHGVCVCFSSSAGKRFVT